MLGLHDFVGNARGHLSKSDKASGMQLLVFVEFMLGDVAYDEMK